MTDNIAIEAFDKSFTEVFHHRINQIEARAQAAGITLTHVCRDSGIARATPDRWRKKVPLTVELIDKMEAVVVEAEQRQAAPNNKQ